MASKYKLSIITFFFLLQILLYSQDTRLSDITFNVLSENIEISYNLDGDSDSQYMIECYLKNDQQVNFNYKLVLVRGDIGKGNFVGESKIIVWEYLKEFPDGLTGDHFYFNITAEEVSGGLSWYYYVGAAVVGSAAAILLGVEADEKVTEPTYATFPSRP